MSIQSAYQNDLSLHFPTGMVIAIAIIFAVAVVLGAFYKNRTPRFLKEKGIDYGDNIAETVLVIIIVNTIMSICYFDGATQLLINVMRGNYDSDIAWAYLISAGICAAFSIAVGLGYMHVKKMSYKKFHRLVK